MPGMISWLLLLALRACIHRRAGYALDVLILGAGAWVFMLHGQWPRLHLAWGWWAAYPLFAALVFGASVWMSASAPGAYLRRLRAALALPQGRRQRRAARRALVVAAYEETVWRLVAQSVLASLAPAWLAILAVGAAFTFLHRTRTRGNLPQIAELFSFSLLLGCLYAAWGDPVLLIALHAVRNYLIDIGNDQHEQA